MEKAKVITYGNTQMVVLPESIRLNCDEVDIDQNGSCIQIMPSKKATFKDFLDIMSGFTEDVADAITEAHSSAFQPEREEL